MPDILDTLASNLVVPTILFFVLGLLAAFARSDLSIPGGAAKFMSLYLLLAIGFKGGNSLAQHGMGARSLCRYGSGCCAIILWSICGLWAVADHDGA